MAAQPQDFYFFDFDKNIMTVKVPLVVTNSVDGTQKSMPAGAFAGIKDQLGKPGPWQDWDDSQLFSHYRDLPNVPPDQQPFVNQIRSAVESGTHEWQAPAWKFFVYACNSQKPFSMITARGHSDETVKAGFQFLKDEGWIRQVPNYLTIYNVTWPPTQKELGDKEGTKDVQDLKSAAILKTVDIATQRFGMAKHHFGMSDDTLGNIEASANAMRMCKLKYPDMRFFVLSTNAKLYYRAEIFPLDVPASDYADTAAPGPLGI